MDTDVPSAKRRKISENMAFETEGVLVCALRQPSLALSCCKWSVVMPVVLWEHSVFPFLMCRDVVSVGLVCKRASQATSSNGVWRMVFVRDHPALTEDKMTVCERLMSWRRRCWGFIGSQLLTNESQRELLLTWRAGAFVPFKLAFSAKRDGFSARAFHQACDPAAESFVVVRSMNGAVFGGYTSQSWALPAVPSAGASAPAPEGSGSASSSPADSKESKEPASLPPRSLFKVDRRAFLFSLIRLQSTPAELAAAAASGRPCQCRLVHDKPTELKVREVAHGIDTDPASGLGFGRGDLTLFEKEHPTYGQSLLGYSYHTPPGVYRATQAASFFLAGDSYFKLEEIEVFVPVHL